MLKNTINKISKIVFITIGFWIVESRFTKLMNFFVTNKYIYSIVLISIILSLILMYVYRNKILDIFNKILVIIDKFSYTKMTCILVLSSFITKTIALLLFQIDSSKHSDILRYWSFIKELSSNNFISTYAEYARMYHHTVMTATFYLPFAKLFGTDNILLFNFYNILLFTLSAYLLFSTLIYLKDKNFAFISVLIWILNPAGIVQPLMLIHENTLVVIHSIVFFLFFKVAPKCNDTKRFTIYISVALLLGYASTINQFSLISMIALSIIYVTKNDGLSKKTFRIISKLLFILLMLISLKGFGTFRTYFVNNHTAEIDFNENNKLSYGWVVYTGLNYETNGMYSQDDSDVWYKYQNVDDYDLNINYQKDLLKERLSWYVEKPMRIIKHLNNKMIIMWSDFNPVGYRGKDGLCFGNKICQWFNDSILDTLSYIAIDYVNLIISLIILVLSLKQYKNKDDEFVLYVKMFVIGVTTILLMVEIMPKYSSHMLMFYMMLFVYCVYRYNELNKR